MRVLFLLFSLFFAAVGINIPAEAGIVLGGTRLIYPEEQKDASLTLKNTENNGTFLVQSWVSNFSDNDKGEVPFVVIPPLFRLDPGKEGVIRVKNSHSNLPKDRESLFWLNVRSIAATDHEMNNALQINISSKIKLIYRPEGLILSTEEIAKKLEAVRTGSGINISNPTPYYINLYSVKINGKSEDNPGIIAPFSQRTFAINSGAKTVSWQLINDYGGITNDVVVHI